MPWSVYPFRSRQKATMDVEETLGKDTPLGRRTVKTDLDPGYDSPLIYNVFTDKDELRRMAHIPIRLRQIMVAIPTRNLRGTIRNARSASLRSMRPASRPRLAGIQAEPGDCRCEDHQPGSPASSLPQPVRVADRGTGSPPSVSSPLVQPSPFPSNSE